MTENIYFKEDTFKPENRVNLTLFHILMIEEVNTFFKEKLGIEENAVIYPVPNLTTEKFGERIRPDFGIRLEDKVQSYIEVELGKEDKGQLTRYREQLNCKIYSIAGKKAYKCDLSLDEIHEKTEEIKEKIRKEDQKYQSLELFHKLIDYYILKGNFKTGNKAQPLSEKTKKDPIICAIYEYFAESEINVVERGEDRCGEGEILLNSRGGEKGYSVKIYSPEASKKCVAVMSHSTIGNKVEFQTENHYKRYLPNHEEEVKEYVNLISEISGKKNKPKEDQKQYLKREKVLENIDEICEGIEKLIQLYM